MPKGPFDLKAWARVGAQQRLREMEEEAREIFSTFPELRSGESPFPWRKRGRPAKAAQATVGRGQRGSGTIKRKRRKLSAAGRKAISDAQKVRWAKQKKAAKKS